MAEFSASVYQNEDLPDGERDVHAIVSVTCSGAGPAGASGVGASEIIIIDTSGSMEADNRMAAAKQAANAALDEILDGTFFGIISGKGAAFLAYPADTGRPGLVEMNARTRSEASRALSQLRAVGDTVISTWLDLAGQLFVTIPYASQRHALLLTAGESNEPPSALDQAISRAVGVYQCDCRGVGVDWKVPELRRIAHALLGSLDIVPTPAAMAEQFRTIMRQSMSRGVVNAALRVGVPPGAEVVFVRQVVPTVEDLTSRRAPVNDRTESYPTGAWGDESRDYHLGIRLPASAVGQEQVAARVQIYAADTVMTEALIQAKWSDDGILTAPIDGQVGADPRPEPHGNPAVRDR